MSEYWEAILLIIGVMWLGERIKRKDWYIVEYRYCTDEALIGIAFSGLG